MLQEGNNPPQIADGINGVLGEGSISSRTCQTWVAKFNAGDFNANDQERSGQPSVDIDDQIINCLREDKYATTSSMSSILVCGKETVREHLLKMGKNFVATSGCHIS